MGKWVNGNFRQYQNKICRVPKIGALEFMETTEKSHGTYHVYMFNPWNDKPIFVVVFDNNEELTKYVSKNVNHLFSIKLIEPDCPIAKYDVYLQEIGCAVTVHTVAAAMVIARKPVEK